MNDEEKNNNNQGVGGLIGLIILLVAGWWIYNHFFVDNSKPWWNGTENQSVCVVHDPNDSSCFTTPVTVEGGRITLLSLPNGSTVVISTNDCGKADTNYGIAGKGKRYCVIGEFGGGREWQVSER